MKSIHISLAAVGAAALLMTGCNATMPVVGDGGAKTVVTGSAGGGTSQNASGQLERCSQPLGTMALVEDQGAQWFKLFSHQYQLNSTVPLLKLMAQQSNCFIVVDRGAAMRNMQTERNLQATGELRAGSNFGKGQMVSADYSITPEVLFSERGTAGGGVGAIIGVFSPVAGAIAGSIKTNEASTMLTLVDNRSGVQVAASEGSSKNTDFGFGGLLGGGGAVAGLGGYTNTPQGKVVAAAFMNAFNQLVQAAKSYTPQTMAGQGLGTGGKLAVDGATPAPAARPVAAEPPAPRSGPAVREAQAHLVKLGYDIGGKPDGNLGRKTVGAIKEFQKDRNLRVTGSLDAATRDELQR